MSDLTRKLLRVTFLLGILVLTPLALDPAEGVRDNEACAWGDACIYSIGSVCMSEGGEVLYNHYLRRSGFE